MAENFYTILTSTGKAKLANSAVLGSKVNFKTLKVGDGKGSYYEPSENQTSLVNQVWSGNIGSISVDENNPNWIVIETLIPATIGGFFIREAGIFDEDDELIAISKLSETYKPVVSEGSIKDLCIKVILEVSNVESVTLKIDPTVIVATKKDIKVLESKIASINSELYTPIYSDPITTDKEVNDVDVDGNKQVMIDVEGKTIINLLGSDGDCEDVSRWNTWNGTISLDSANKVFGSNAIKITQGNSSGATNCSMFKIVDNFIDKTKYYCLSAYLKNFNADSVQLLAWKNDGASGNKFGDKIYDTSRFVKTFIKLQPSDYDNTRSTFGIQLNGLQNQYGYVDGIMLEEITKEQYDDINFKPSLYVSKDLSVGEVTTRVRTRGKNMLNLVQGTVGTVGMFNTNITRLTHKDGAIIVKPNTTYTISLDKPLLFGGLNQFDANKNQLTVGMWGSSTISSFTFTTSADTKYIAIAFKISDTTTIFAEDYKIQLEEGSVVTLYEPYQQTSINLDIPLRSLSSGVKDEIKDSKLIKRVEKVALDGSLNWCLLASQTGYKQVQAAYTIQDTSYGTYPNSMFIKYNNKILPRATGVASSDNDCGWTISNLIRVDIPSSDSGWGDNYTPTSDEIKAYFNGWSMYDTSVGSGSNTSNIYNRTDGNYKGWSRVQWKDYGTGTYPITMALGYTPYRLYYQLATPIVQELSVPQLVSFKDGGLVLESDNQSWIRPKIIYKIADNLKANVDKLMKDVSSAKRNISEMYQYRTYNELAILVQNKQLKTGAKYVLIDYRTKYIQPDTKVLKEMGVERLVLTATSECTFSSTCSSIDYPKDIIHYRFDLNVCEDGVTPRTGFITRRIDESFDVQIDAPLDWRKMLWARWLPNQTQYLIGTVLTNYATWTSGAAQLNIVYKVGNALYMAYNNNTPTSSTDGNVFLCIYPDITVGMLLNADLKIGSNGASDIILQKSSLYKEYLTFGAGCSRICVDNSGCDNNEGTGIIHLHNNVFISDCDDNTLGFSCHDNTFGAGFDGNVLGPYCYNNFFLGNCDCNVFEANCFNNRMVGNVWNIHLGAGCYNNIFNAYCRAMKFAGDCYNNTFGLQCYCNTFEKDCHDNYFGNLCAYNTCTNGFYANRISNECYTNFFGSSCRNNIFGYQSSNNHFSSDCFNNNCGSGFWHNTLSTGCYNNTFGNSCINNTFGSECRDNVFGNNFGSNALSTSTVQNIFGNNKYNMIIKYMRSKNVSAITALENRDYTTTIEKRNDGYIVYWSLNSSNVPVYTTIP